MKNLLQKFLLCSLLMALPQPARTQDTGTPPERTATAPIPAAKPQETIKTPSPNGEFAFLEIAEPAYRNEGTVDLIELPSKKVLLRVVDAINVSWSARWAPDSQRFSITFRTGHAVQGVDVYARHRKTFREVKLPRLGADVPKRLTRGKSFPHFANLNYQSVDRWIGNHKLKLEICTVMDGEADTVSATRQVVLGFDRSDRVHVLRSTIEYDSEHYEN